MEHQDLWIDLSDIELEDVEILSQEGGRGIPEFAASSGGECCAMGACSCSAPADAGTMA